ncbi:YcxB family protein [Undibacterium flavidum]|uniref:YcxB family protein n=1 Tax=Undibacterium flavidum TaxID=2762297 RepID=A0ABR6YBV8_9BURK|nr:YcxB family protein [Undibacterium flavidum]MBC3874058.1 YcxB family protein [Undibacterium flavidum]
MNTTQRIEASFSPSFRERISAEWSLLLRNPIGLIAMLVFPGAGVLLVSLLLLHPDKVANGTWLTALIAFIFSPAMFFFNSYRAHRVMQAQGLFTYAFDQEGIHISTPLAQSLQRWPAIIRVRTSGNLLFVYFSKRCAYFVPMRAFVDSDAVDAIEKLARAGGVPRVGA